jgi:hypothetical protein
MMELNLSEFVDNYSFILGVSKMRFGYPGEVCRSIDYIKKKEKAQCPHILRVRYVYVSIDDITVPN